MNAFAMSPDAGLWACGDGPELLVYDGSGQPRWKRFLDEIVAGLAIQVNWVAVAMADGTLIFMRPMDGEELRRFDLGQAPRGLIAAPDETLAAICQDGVVICGFQGEVRPLVAKGLQSAAFGPNRGSLGYGTAEGKFTALDTNTGVAWGSVTLPGAIEGVAWSAKGLWVVSTPAGVHFVSGDGGTLLGKLPASQAGLGELAVSRDGVIVAVVEGGQAIAVYETVGNAAAGHVRYRRDICGLRFGPGGLLGIALDDGDANTLDLFTGATARTEPHSGRGRNNWNLHQNIDQAGLRGATVRAKAKGEAVATFIEHEYGPPPEESTARWWIGVMLGCGLLGFFFFTTVTSGAMIAGWYYVNL